MAYFSFNELWGSEFGNIVSKRDKLQDLNINQLKLKVHDTYKKDGKITTNFEPTDDSDIIKKSYLDEKFKKRGSLIFFRKRLERNFVTIQQTVCRRHFNSKNCGNDFSNIKR